MAQTFDLALAAPRHSIDPVAFFIALIGAPLLATLMWFWVLLIPVAALLIGGPIYLALGTPLLMIYLQRHPCTVGGIVFLAVCGVLALLPLGWLVALSTGQSEALYIALFFCGFGLIFGPLWATHFAFLYRKMARDPLALPGSI